MNYCSEAEEFLRRPREGCYQRSCGLPPGGLENFPISNICGENCVSAGFHTHILERRAFVIIGAAEGRSKRLVWSEQKNLVFKGHILIKTHKKRHSVYFTSNCGKGHVSE